LLVNGEFESAWKEVIMAEFEVGISAFAWMD
jgi:hypothetical protein